MAFFQRQACTIFSHEIGPVVTLPNRFNKDNDCVICSIDKYWLSQGGPITGGDSKSFQVSQLKSKFVPFRDHSYITWVGGVGKMITFDNGGGQMGG